VSFDPLGFICQACTDGFEGTAEAAGIDHSRFHADRPDALDVLIDERLAAFEVVVPGPGGAIDPLEPSGQGFGFLVYDVGGDFHIAMLSNEIYSGA